MMSCDMTFEFEAPQFIDSWERATDVDDGADHFFDALDSLDSNAGQQQKNNLFKVENEDIFKTNNSGFSDTDNIKSKIAQDVENMCSRYNTEVQDESRRLSLKRKASPLKDRNENAPSSTSFKHQHRKLKKGIQFLPTIAESPVLLTKSRSRPKSVPENDPDSRIILKPVRKRNIGVCVKPLPKPPTIPEPFNLTEAGKHVHQCYEDSSEKEISFVPSITPGKRNKKKRLEVDTAPVNETKLITPSKSAPFSFYERDQEIMKRKLERMNPKNEDNGIKFEFKAKSPSVLKKEPFRPDVPGRLIEASSPELSTEERARRKEMSKSVHSCFGEKKMQELEESLFVFKAQPGPKGNSSFISTASSSKRNFFNSSVASSICTNTSDKSSSTFSFYERDMELLKRKQERMKQVEVPKFDFKAKEPTILNKEPFWPEIEHRIIPEGSTPDLATEKRAEQRKKYELRKQQAAERQKKYEEELKKAQEEEIRKFRKTLEFKATSIKKSSS